LTTGKLIGRKNYLINSKLIEEKITWLPVI
jgi:hypothetical protein